MNVFTDRRYNCSNVQQAAAAAAQQPGLLECISSDCWREGGKRWAANPSGVSLPLLVAPGVVSAHAFAPMADALALDRVRTTESALAKLRAELDDLERESGPQLLGYEDPSARLGPAVEDLARMHEEHAATVRQFGRVLGTGDEAPPWPPSGYAYAAASSSRAPPAPQYSAEPDLGLSIGGRGVGIGGGSAGSTVGQSAPSLPPRPSFARPLLEDALGGHTVPPQQPATTQYYSHSAADEAIPAAAASSSGARPPRPPSTSASLDTMPMNRPQHARAQVAQAQAARAEAVAATRYAREAAARREAAEQATARVMEAQQRQQRRSGYLTARSADEESNPLGEWRGHGGSASARASTSATSAQAATAAPPSQPQQRLAESASAPLPVRPLPVRPASAPRERPRITVPTPFSFEHRPKRDHAALRKMQQELAEERLAIEDGKKENKARPVPATNEPGLYMAQVEKMKEKSQERRAVRRTVPQPFSFQSRSERKAAAVSGMASADDDAFGGTPYGGAGVSPYGDGRPYGDVPGMPDDVAGRQSFRARDVPRSMSEPRWEMMRIREAERKEKCAQEALRLAAKSKLPPRMQQHKETERARRAAEAERIQAELDAELTLQPRITDEPQEGYDAYFKRLHLEDERRQARKRSSYQPTVPAPFRMDMAPIKERRDEKRKMKRYMEQQDMRRDALMMPEQRWPYLATQAPVGRTNPPDFAREHKQAPVSETTELFKARAPEPFRSLPSPPNPSDTLRVLPTPCASHLTALPACLLLFAGAQGQAAVGRRRRGEAVEGQEERRGEAAGGAEAGDRRGGRPAQGAHGRPAQPQEEARGRGRGQEARDQGEQRRAAPQGQGVDRRHQRARARAPHEEGLHVRAGEHRRRRRARQGGGARQV